MILFTDKLQRADSTYPIVDSSDVKGGFFTVDDETELSLIPILKLLEGMLAYAKTLKKHYSYDEEGWKEASLGGVVAVENISDYNEDHISLGLLIYVISEDTTYQYNGYEFKPLDSIIVSDQEPDNKNVLWLDPSGEGLINNGGLTTIQTQIRTLQNLVLQLMNIINYGAVAGDSSLGTRVSILNSAEPINPNEETEPDEETDDSLIEPTSDGLYPTVPHISIKMDTLENFVKNKRNLIDGELIWISDKGRLFIFIDGSFKPVSSGVVNDDEETNGDDMTQQDIEALYFNKLGFVDSNATQYYVQVNEDGNVIVYNSTNYDGERLGSSLEITSDVGGSYISNYLRINSVFLGGLNTKISSFLGATHNFVELANGSDNDINLNGIYLLYCGESTTTYWDYLSLKGTIKSGSTFLIRGALCSVKTNTNVSVDTYDMLWYDSEGNLKQFDADGGTFYLVVSNENKIYNPSSSSYVDVDKFPISVNPYASTIPTGYIDLVGIGSGKKAEKNPVVPSIGEKITDCIFFRLYALDPGYGTVLKKYELRDSSYFWTYCNMTKKYTDDTPYFTEAMKKRFSPLSSKSGKNFFGNKQVFAETKPNLITLTLGKLGTVQGENLATRCLNWVSVGYYDEYVEYKQLSADTWTRIYSYDGTNDNGDTVLSTFSQVYKRFRWVSSNGTAVTTHKVIIRNLNTGTYQYRIGRDGDASYLSETRTFTIKDSSTNFNFIHTSDQQGFNYNEYCAWIKAAKTIRLLETYDFVINTGDMTQSGNRESEWLDYCLGRDVLGDVPEMACIGNNDLCGADLFRLGKGVASTDKINSLSIWLFYTFELDINNSVYFKFKYEDNGVGKLLSSKIGNVIEYDQNENKYFTYFIPSVYSFDYGNYHFICLNSEFAVNENVYSIYYNDSAITQHFKQSAYYLLYKWLEKDIEDNPNKNYICYHHEIPFNIVKLGTGTTAIARTATNGSLLNRDFSQGIAYTDYTDSASKYVGGCCFSEFFQKNGIKLVLGGHKHTYSLSYPVVENVQLVNETRTVTYASPYVITGNLGDTAIDYTNGVVYCMSLATGFKLSSNNDKPGLLDGSDNTNWLYHFYPYGSALNTGLLYPMYSVINCSGLESELDNVVKIDSYAVSGVYKHENGVVTAFNINALLRTDRLHLQNGDGDLTCEINYTNNTVKYQNNNEISISKSSSEE